MAGSGHGRVRSWQGQVMAGSGHSASGVGSITGFSLRSFLVSPSADYYSYINTVSTVKKEIIMTISIAVEVCYLLQIEYLDQPLYSLEFGHKTFFVLFLICYIFIFFIFCCLFICCFIYFCVSRGRRSRGRRSRGRRSRGRRSRGRRSRGRFPRQGAGSDPGSPRPVPGTGSDPGSPPPSAEMSGT